MVPVAILVAFVWSGHFMAAIENLGEVAPGWAIVLVLVGIALPFTHAWRWCLLLRRIGEPMRLAASARMTALSSLLNYAAPGFLGAPAKAIFARNETGVPVSRSLPTLIAEQTLDALLLLIGGALAVLVAGPVLIAALLDLVSLEGSLLAIVIVAGALAAIAMIWFLSRRLIPSFIGSVESSLRTLMRGRTDLGLISVLTLSRWLLDMLAVGIASIAVGLRLSVVEILLIANLSLLAGLVAPVPGGLGVREAVMVAIGGVFGISVPAILALSVLHRAGLGIGLPIVFSVARLREWSVR
jgi:uncharacterized protein (TIRG00374 family)